MEEALYEIASVRNFAGLDLRKAIPDASAFASILRTGLAKGRGIGRSANAPADPPEQLAGLALCEPAKPVREARLVSHQGGYTRRPV